MLESLVFSCTYKCPIKCKYCGAESGPKQNDRLSLEEIKKFVEEVYSMGKLQLVVFTGGEPLLLGDDLYKAVEFCSKKKLATRIVSNAYWAVSPEKSQEVLSDLKTAGLTEINLSCDDYHQEFISLEKIKYANDACIELDIPCLIGHKIMKDHKISIEYLEEFLSCELAIFDPEKENPSNNVISTGYTVPVCKDMHLIPDNDILYPPSTHNWKAPCKTLLQRIIITPHKELSICCGMIPRSVKEVVFEGLGDYSIEEMIYKAHKDLIVNWLALEGPYGIMKFIQKKKSDISFRNQYVNICHLCSEIFTREECREILRTYGSEKAMEIQLERSLYDYIRTEDSFA